MPQFHQSTTRTSHGSNIIVDSVVTYPEQMEIFPVRRQASERTW
jgi:hypothetical protein